MAIGIGSLLRMTMVQRLLSSEVLNIWDYVVLESSAVISAGDYAQAWWNHVKATYRALVPSDYGPAFLSVRCTELGVPLGEYGEYGVPTAEQAGTRSPTAANQPPAAFLAAGVRLTVPTRVTRPGQKRFAFLTEADTDSDNLGAAFQALVVSHMNVMTSNMLLGAPALASVLVPHVVGLNADGTVRASQAVNGYSVNPFVTSQVSRKRGRGI